MDMKSMKLSLVLNATNFDLNNEKLKKLKSNLNKANIPHRWIPNDWLNISLLSLGEADEEKMLELNLKIGKIILNHGPFELNLRDVKAYPNLIQGRLIWIGVQNSIPLRSLQEELAENLIGENTYQKEKPFRPVLPIVRLKNYHNLKDILSPCENADFGKIKIEQLLLFDMIMGGAFPAYKLIKSYLLKCVMAFL
jgi:RNA 2',3'-cyclic 3'-phosphodiesterase